MTTTTILARVTAAAAVRTASQCGWARIDVDLSAWPQDARDVLSEHVKDGERGAECSLEVAPPTAEQLRVVVDALVVERAKELAEDVARLSAAIATAREADIESATDNYPVSKGSYNMSSARWSAALTALGFSRPEFGVLTWRDIGRGDEWTALQERRNAERAARDAAKAERERAERAERLAREAAAQAALEELLDPAVRARRADGYCDSREYARLLTDAAKSQLREELTAAGLDCASPAYVGGAVTSSLTDEQYAELVRVRPLLPADVTHEVKRVYDSRTECACDDHDSYDSDCDECCVRWDGPRAVLIVNCAHVTVRGV